MMGTRPRGAPTRAHTECTQVYDQSMWFRFRVSGLGPLVGKPWTQRETLGPRVQGG